MPEIGFGAVSNVGASTTFVGASFIARRAIRTTELLWRISSAVGANYIIAIYQAPGGGSGVATLLATVSETGKTSGATTVALPLLPSPPTIEEGLYYVLWGASAGTLLLTCYAPLSIPMLNGAEVNGGVHPTGFTTAIAVSGGAPATFNPAASTGDAIPSSNTVALEHRFQP
jgi:hypothetical protein